METIILHEVAKAYGLPVAVGMSLIFVIWQSRSRREREILPSELHVELQAIRDKLIRIETLLETRD